MSMKKWCQKFFSGMPLFSPSQASSSRSKTPQTMPFLIISFMIFIPQDFHTQRKVSFRYQELQDSLRAAEVTLRAEAKRSIGSLAFFKKQRHGWLDTLELATASTNGCMVFPYHGWILVEKPWY